MSGAAYIYPFRQSSAGDSLARGHRTWKPAPGRETPAPATDSPFLIAVMGLSRSGKTTFVNSASDSQLQVGESSRSCTSMIQLSNEFELHGKRIALVDTPGFNNTNMSDMEVLELIAMFLRNLHFSGKKLAGILYIHRVCSPEQERTLTNNFRVFKELCGEAMGNAILVMLGHYLGETDRERELKKRYSQLAVNNGARVSYVYDMPGSAQEIVHRILGADVPVTLKLQRELIEEGRELRRTAAGEELRRIEVEELQRRELEEEADGLRKYIAEMQSGEIAMREVIDMRDKELRRALDESEMRRNEVYLLEERISEMARYTEKMERELEVYRQALEEQGRKASHLGEMQSKSEEDRSGLPLDQSSPDFGDRINKVLYGREYEQCIQNFKKEDSVWLVDYLDRALDNLDPSCPASRKCIRELRSICGTQTILPTSHLISSDLLNVDSHPFTSGGFGEVYRGTLDGTAVCVKRLLVQTWAIPFATMMEMFCREAVTWKYLQHPNILPLLGATISPPQLVSVFMPAGDLPKYIRENPDASRIGLISEIAEGLRYLHSRSVIHGDLKGMNILVDVVDGVPHARIADFGIAVVTKNLNSTRPVTPQDIHSPTWSAPEILSGENPSKESDVYSFAVVMIEVLSGQVPFNDLKTNWVVVQAVWGGKRPPRPVHPCCTDDLWTLIQRCWDQDPSLRPEIPEVSQTLSSVSTE